jgi:hypothetical protein
MNDVQLQKIDKAIDLLKNILADFNELKFVISTVASEERACYENMTDNITQDEYDEQASEAADWLEEASCMLEDFDIETILNKLFDAKGLHHG